MSATVPGGYLVIDRDGVILEVNDDVSRYLGHGQELVGQMLAVVLPLASRVFFQTHVFPTLAREGRVDEVYLPIRAKSGESLPVVLNCRTSGDDGSRIEILFVPMRRRTFFERELVRARQAAELSAINEAQAHRKIDVMQSQLALAERMASIGELAAAVAHEINNPLAYVSANVDLLASDGAIAGESTSIVADLQLGVSRIRDIVASLKKLSRVDAVERAPVDVVRAIEDALKIAGNDLRHRAQIELAVADRELLVMGDEGRLGQVLLNLLINAAQALPEDRLAENLVRIEARRTADEQIEIVIGDNGPGIPADLHERIFDPFFTTKPIGTGTGLGLSVCHGVVTSLGGTISLDSAPGRGARFTIRLPAVPRNELKRPDAVVPGPTPAPAAERRARLLLIDDDAAVGRVLRRVFRDHDIDWCESSVGAWERFERDGFDPYDAIVCDLMMPQMTGMELFARVTQRAPQLAKRFVFLTGGAFTETAHSFLEQPGRRAVTKPFKVPELRAAVLDVAREVVAPPTVPRLQ